MHLCVLQTERSVKLYRRQHRVSLQEVTFGCEGNILAWKSGNEGVRCLFIFSRSVLSQTYETLKLPSYPAQKLLNPEKLVLSKIPLTLSFTSAYLIRIALPAVTARPAVRKDFWES